MVKPHGELVLVS